MAQRYTNIFPSNPENCYTQITPAEQDLSCPYSYFVSNGANQQAFTQPQNYHCENIFQYKQPSPPYYQIPTNTNTQFHIPTPQNPVCPQSIQRLGMIQRQKSRNVPLSTPVIPHKRMRIEEQLQVHTAQMYQQTNTEAMYQQPHLQQAHVSIDTPYPFSVKHPLETQSNEHSSPSRSPILNISTSPNNTRTPQDELKYNQQQRMPVDTHPCNRFPANLNVPPSSTLSSNQVEPTESDTSPLNNFPTSTVGGQSEILDTILIQDEDDPETELVIVSVKSPTVPIPEQAISPIQPSHAVFDEPEIIPNYENNLTDNTQVHHLPISNMLQASVLPVNNTIETNQYFAPEQEYPPQPTPATSYMNQMQTPFYMTAFPQQTDSYAPQFYPRTCMPNPFYTRPQPMMARTPMQNNFRRMRPYDYQMPTVYSSVPFRAPPGHFHDYITQYEEAPPLIVQHSVPHTHHRSKKPGMTRAELKKLETKKYKMADYEEKDESCVICMDEYREGDKLLVLPCKHEYHRECVKDWLVKQRNCPLCRKEVYAK